MKKKSIKIFKATFNQNIVTNNFSNCLKFLSLLMIAFSNKTERIGMYWALIPVMINFAMYFYHRIFSREMRLIPLGYKIFIILYHFLENLQICFVSLYLGKMIPSYVMIIPYAILVVLVYIVLFRTILGRINSKLFFIMCAIHYCLMVVGNFDFFVYFKGAILAFCAPCFTIILQIFVYLRFRSRLH